MRTAITILAMMSITCGLIAEDKPFVITEFDKALAEQGLVPQEDSLRWLREQAEFAAANIFRSMQERKEEAESFTTGSNQGTQKALPFMLLLPGARFASAADAQHFGANLYLQRTVDRLSAFRSDGIWARALIKLKEHITEVTSKDFQSALRYIEEGAPPDSMHWLGALAQLSNLGDNTDRPKSADYARGMGAYYESWYKRELQILPTKSKGLDDVLGSAVNALDFNSWYTPPTNAWRSSALERTPGMSQALDAFEQSRQEALTNLGSYTSQLSNEYARQVVDTYLAIIAGQDPPTSIEVSAETIEDLRAPFLESMTNHQTVVATALEGLTNKELVDAVVEAAYRGSIEFSDAAAAPLANVADSSTRTIMEAYFRQYVDSLVMQRDQRMAQTNDPGVKAAIKAAYDQAIERNTTVISKNIGPAVAGVFGKSIMGNVGEKNAWAELVAFDVSYSQTAINLMRSRITGYLDGGQGLETVLGIDPDAPPTKNLIYQLTIAELHKFRNLDIKSLLMQVRNYRIYRHDVEATLAGGGDASSITPGELGELDVLVRSPERIREFFSVPWSNDVKIQVCAAADGFMRGDTDAPASPITAPPSWDSQLFHLTNLLMDLLAVDADRYAAETIKDLPPTDPKVARSLTASLDYVLPMIDQVATVQVNTKGALRFLDEHIEDLDRYLETAFWPIVDAEYAKLPFIVGAATTIDTALDRYLAGQPSGFAVPANNRLTLQAVNAGIVRAGLAQQSVASVLAEYGMRIGIIRGNISQRLRSLLFGTWMATRMESGSRLDANPVLGYFRGEYACLIETMAHYVANANDIVTKLKSLETSLRTSQITAVQIAGSGSRSDPSQWPTPLIGNPAVLQDVDHVAEAASLTVAASLYLSYLRYQVYRTRVMEMEMNLLIDDAQVAPILRRWGMAVARDKDDKAIRARASNPQFLKHPKHPSEALWTGLLP